MRITKVVQLTNHIGREYLDETGLHMQIVYAEYQEHISAWGSRGAGWVAVVREVETGAEYSIDLRDTLDEDSPSIEPDEQD